MSIHLSEPILPPLILLPRSAEDVGRPQPVKEGQPCNAKSHPFFTPSHCLFSNPEDA